MSRVALVHIAERSLLAHRGALAGSQMIVVRRLRGRPAGLVDWLTAVSRCDDRRLVNEGDGDRGEVGLSSTDPLCKGLEAIAVPVGADGVLGVEVRLLAGAGERDVGALAGNVG
jgi:hypothetical protein